VLHIHTIKNNISPVVTRARQYQSKIMKILRIWLQCSLCDDCHHCFISWVIGVMIIRLIIYAGPNKSWSHRRSPPLSLLYTLPFLSLPICLCSAATVLARCRIYWCRGGVLCRLTAQRGPAARQQVCRGTEGTSYRRERQRRRWYRMCHNATLSSLSQATVRGTAAL